MLGEDDSFAALKRISNEANTKLRDIAERVVDTGSLPGVSIRALPLAFRRPPRGADQLRDRLRDRLSAGDGPGDGGVEASECEGFGGGECPLWWCQELDDSAATEGMAVCPQ